MACSTSRASVFLARQAVAPKPIICRHSAGDGLLASTSRRDCRKAAWSSRRSAGLESEPKLRIATSGACAASVAASWSGAMSVATSAQVRVLVDQRLQAAVDDVLELGDGEGDRLGGDVMGASESLSGYTGTLTRSLTPDPPKFTPLRGRKPRGSGDSTVSI